MSKITELIAKQKQMTEELVAEAEAYYASVGPVEVETVFGETKAKFLIPFMHPRKFSDLADHHPPRPGVAVDGPLWFNIDAVARVYPGVTLLVGGEADDMYRVRDKEAVYVWPELYDEMPPEDQQNFRMAVWGLNVWEPQQRREAKKAQAEEIAEALKDAALNEFVDAVVAMEEVKNA